MKWLALTGMMCFCFGSIATSGAQEDLLPKTLERLLPESNAEKNSRISDADIAAAQQLGQSISIAEWLGPMAPVALSPFFGITCLSGMSLFGGKWISSGNPLVGEASPLHNSAVFWTFLALTIVTSIPRFTKVSKPFAQAVDQLESWSGIVTMITIRFLMASGAESAEAPEIVQAGIMSVSTDVLMMFAAAVNIVVINTVKFFFEVLIWLTPIPLLDATFEVLNKTLCAGLMVVYAWSPVAALILNLVMLATAAILYGWIHRRVIFFKTILFDFVWAFLSKSNPNSMIVVFPAHPVDRIRTRAKCQLYRTENGWILQHRPLLRSSITVTIPDQSKPSILCGMFTNTMTFSEPSLQLTFSRLYNGNLSSLAASLNAALQDAPDFLQPRAEFS